MFAPKINLEMFLFGHKKHLLAFNIHCMFTKKVSSFHTSKDQKEIVSFCCVVSMNITL